MPLRATAPNNYPRLLALPAAPAAKKSKPSSQSSTPVTAKATPVAQGPSTAELDASLVGKPVQVWWGGDSAWYTGKVIDFDTEVGSHTVQYEDGDEDTYMFNNEKVRTALNIQTPSILRQVPHLADSHPGHIWCHCGSVSTRSRGSTPDIHTRAEQPRDTCRGWCINCRVGVATSQAHSYCRGA